MPRSTNRTLALATAGFLALLAAAPGLAADVPRFSTVIGLAEDPDVSRRLEAARDNIEAEAWRKAVAILQSVLDAQEDVFVPQRRLGPDGKATVVRVSARGEANRLLADLPPKAQEFYRLTYGPHADEILAGARQSGRVAELVEVVRRYRHTSAGADATRRLAIHHLDRGRVSLAARYFRMALESERAPAPLLCFQAALAFRRAGDKAGADWAWKLLSKRAPNGLRLGKHWLNPTDLRQRLEKLAPFPPPSSGPGADWRMFRGDAGRLSQAGPARLAGPTVKRWSRPTAGQDDTLVWLRKAEQLQASSPRPMLPASFPLLAGERLLYRSHRGVTAVDQSTGAFLWESPSAWGLDAITEDIDSYPHISAWADTHLSRNPYLLVENSLLGTLSADRGRVYAVDDLPLPPILDSFRSDKELQLPLAPDLSNAIHHNRLLALDLVSGKVVWQRGGRAAADPLRDSYFLGPPLSLDGALYALVEGEQEMSLVCLGAAHGELLWKQKLAVPHKKLLLDGARRTYVAPLAHADGILVCPTNAGALVALDVLTRELLWAHAYRKEKPRQVVEEAPPPWRRRRPGRFARLPPAGPLPDKSWRASSPIIHRGKVIFTAPDEPSVQCLDLRTGALCWRADYSEGLFVAATGDRVLVVGWKNSRAVRLADGKEVWNLATETPAGEGVLVGTVYYLPVRGEDKKQPALHAIDVNKGAITRIPWPGGGPGNLLFARGQVFSQTAGVVCCAGRAVGPARLAGPVAAARLAEPLDRLIKQLGSCHFAEREAADTQLRALGEPVLKALRRAAHSGDAEVRRRAARLLRLIDQDVRAVRLLAPVRVRLVCKDMPVPVAVANLARKSGMPLQLAGDQTKLVTRKVTLDTGEVPFWEALDQLCAKAGLVEKPPAAPAQGGVRGRSIVFMGGGRARVVQPRDILRPETAVERQPLVLMPGEPAKLPTHRAGAVRIRALPPDADSQTATAGEVRLVLAGSAGPHLVWDKAVALRIHKALDDQGQALKQVMAALQTDADTGRAAVFINRVPIRAPEDREQPRIPVRLEQGKKPSKRLKELTGTVLAQVRTPPEPLVVVDDIFKAVGRTVKGPRGGAVKVLEIKREADGRVRLRFQVEAPPRGVEDVPLPFNGTIMIDGKVIGPHQEPLSAQNFALLDGAKPLPAVAAVNTGVRAGSAQVVELAYQVAEGKLAATKFIYSGRRTTIIKVPFTLKDVPLPP